MNDLYTGTSFSPVYTSGFALRVHFLNATLMILSLIWTLPGAHSILGCRFTACLRGSRRLKV